MQGKWWECLDRAERDLERTKQLWQNTLMTIRMCCSHSEYNKLCFVRGLYLIAVLNDYPIRDLSVEFLLDLLVTVIIVM